MPQLTFDEKTIFACLALAVLAFFRRLFRQDARTEEEGNTYPPDRQTQGENAAHRRNTDEYRDIWRAGIPDKDKTEIVTDGIYKFSRNPAFLGFDFMYIDVLLMYLNPLTAFFSLFAVLMLHLQILQEEKYLENTFGEAYTSYKKRTLRYLGRRK